MESIKKTARLIAILILFTLTSAALYTAALPGTAHAEPEKSDPVKIVVEGGYMGTAVLGSTVPLSISIVNEGPDIDGEIHVEVPVDDGSVDIYAVPISLPKGTVKNINVSVPLNMSVQIAVKFLHKGNVIESMVYHFKKLIQQGTPVFGVFSNDAEALRGLSKIEINSLYSSGYPEEKIMLMIAAGEIVPEMFGKAEVIFPDIRDFPDTPETFEIFDYIVINDLDTGLLSDKQVSMLESWVDNGGVLIIGTGPAAEHLYAGFPVKLKPFEFRGSAAIEDLSALAEYAMGSAKQAMKDNKNEQVIAPPDGSLQVMKMDTGDGEVLLEQDSIPLLLMKRTGLGIVAAMAFNPGLEPIYGWDGQEAMWKRFLNELAASLNAATAAASTVTGYISSFESFARQVPVDKLPPFKTLFLILGIYVLFIGPVLYIILKKKDRRGLSWILIPVASLIFVMIIYVAGFGTRYTTAVTNNVSIIHLDDNRKTADISTVTAIFNNRRNSMTFSYDDGLDIRLNPGYSYYYNAAYPVVYGSSGKIDRKVRMKIYLTDPRVYELYNVNIWDARFAYTNSSMSIAGKVFESVSMKDGEYHIKLYNTTPFDLFDAFIAIGNRFVEVGDLLQGDRKEIRGSFYDASVETRYEDFMYKRYMETTSQDSPEDSREKSRKYNLFNRMFQRIRSYTQGSNGLQPYLQLYALNYDRLGPSLEVNGRQPEVYDTNIVYATSGNVFKSGEKVAIPPGVIIPGMEGSQSKAAYISGGYDQYIRFVEDGDAVFIFDIPGSIMLTSIRLRWSTFTSLAVKARMLKDPGEEYGSNIYTFSIYNAQSGEWEEFDREILLEDNVYEYVSGIGQLRVKVSATLENNKPVLENLMLPEIEAEGVVR